jgi:uncharacterized phage protein (TIGR02218 family)
MGKTATTNLKNRMAQQTTTIAQCYRLTITQQLPVITNVVSGASSQQTITTQYVHNLPTGASVQIKGVFGFTNLDEKYAVITSAGSTTVDVIVSGVTGAYTSGGHLREAYGVTNIDRDIVYDGVTYKASTGGLPTNLRTTSDMSVSTMGHDGVFTDDVDITKYDIHTGRLDFAEVEVFLIDYEYPEYGKMIQTSGFMGQLQLQEEAYTAEFNSLNEVLVKDVTKSIGNLCKNTLGDSRCQVNLAAYTSAGSVTAVGANVRDQFTDAAVTGSDAYYRNGVITFTSGANAGVPMEVLSYSSVSHTFVLYEGLSFDIEVGDTYTATAGCDKRFVTCKQFSAQVNFDAFPHVPGNSVLTEVGNQK